TPPLEPSTAAVDGAQSQEKVLGGLNQGENSRHSLEAAEANCCSSQQSRGRHGKLELGAL
ncbi:Hypothetical predicted protein, partial [Marmota monax]